MEVFAGGGASFAGSGTASDVLAWNSSAGGDMNLHVASVITASTTLLINFARLLMALL